MATNLTPLALPQTPPWMHPETTTTVTEAPTTTSTTEQPTTTTTSQVETPTTTTEALEPTSSVGPEPITTWATTPITEEAAPTPVTEVEVHLAPATSIAYADVAPQLPHTGVDTTTIGTVGAALLALGMIATALAQRCNR